jgi:hypothetical protein
MPKAAFFATTAAGNSFLRVEGGIGIHEAYAV